MTQGTLRQTGGGRWDWWPVDGDPVEGVGNPADAPRGRLIDAHFVDGRVVGYEPLPEPQRQPTGRMAMCQVWVVQSEEDDTDSLRERMARDALEWEHRMRTQNPRGDYECGYCVVVSRQSAGLFFSPYQERDQIPDFEHWTHWCIRGGYKPGTNGEAYLGDNKLALYPGADSSTFPHETRHCEDEGHSNGPDGTEYNDSDCNLGRAQTGLNALHAFRLGYIERVEEVSESATVHLVPVEVEPDDLMNGEYHAAKVEHNGRKYLLSLRKTQNQHYSGVRNHDPGTLFIHKPADSRWWANRSLYQGSTDSETEVEGIKLRNLGGGVIQIIIDGKPAPEPVAPKPLLVAPGDQPGPEHSALWHDPRFEHQGFDFTIHGDRLTGYWFGYHPRGPHGSGASQNNGQRWMIFHGHIKDGYVEFEAQSVQRGEPQDEGRGTIRFDGDTALLRWDTGMYGREHYRLKRMSPVKINPELYSFGDYAGISVAEYDLPQPDMTIQRETWVYYYGPGMGGQSWYVMSGQRDDLKVMSVSSRHRETHPGDVENLGTAEFVDGGFRMLGRTHDINPIPLD